MGFELVDHFVDGFAGFDEEDYFAWFLEAGAEFFEGFCGLDFFVAAEFDEFCSFFLGTIKNGDLKSFVGNVAGEVLAHDGESN